MLVMPILLQTKLSIFEAQNEYYSNWYSFAPALATRSGTAPRIGIFRPGVGNMLGGCASNWHYFAPALVTRSRAAPYNPMLAKLGGYAYMLTLAFTPLALSVDNTLEGCASYTANLSSSLHCLLHLKQHTVDYVNSGLYC
jgi:hypothetical protein